MLKTANVLKDIKTYKDYTFNTILADPPYNLSTVWHIAKDGTYQVKGASKDFMNKWSGITGPQLDEFFHHSHRIIKHGGYCILFGMDRQIAPFQYYAIKNGFEICQNLYWYFISSFPKATDAGKAIDERMFQNWLNEHNDVKQAMLDEIAKDKKKKDKIIARYKKEAGFAREVIEQKRVKSGGTENMNKHNHNKYEYRPSDYQKGENILDITTPATPLAKQYNGYKYGVAPFKQVVETIMVFRKPCRHGSILNDLMQANDDDTISPCIINIDGSRVPLANKADYEETKNKNRHADFNSNDGIRQNSPNDIYSPDLRPPENYDPVAGRYPPQMFICPEAAELIDEQSGELKGFVSNGEATERTSSKDAITPLNRGKATSMNDTGGASRIMHAIQYMAGEYDLCLYEPKVSSAERNAGLQGFEEQAYGQSGGAQQAIKEGKEEYIQKGHIGLNRIKKVKNNHPTLKPINLICQIAKLFKLPAFCNQKWYVPFSGSGSEVIGIHKADVSLKNITACEGSDQYNKIARARIAWWTKQFKHNKTLPAKDYIEHAQPDNQVQMEF